MKTYPIHYTQRPGTARTSPTVRPASWWRAFAAAAVALLSVFAPLASHAQTTTPTTPQVVAVQRSGIFGLIPGQAFRVNIVFCDGSVLPNPNLIPYDVYAQVAFIDEKGNVVKASERTKIEKGKLISAEFPVDAPVLAAAAAAATATKVPVRAEVQLSVNLPTTNARFRFPRPLTIDLGSAVSTLEIVDSNTQGILIGLLLPAVQRVREAAAIVVPE